MNAYFLKEIGLEEVFPVLHVVIYSNKKQKKNYLSLLLNHPGGMAFATECITALWI